MKYGIPVELVDDDRTKGFYHAQHEWLLPRKRIEKEQREANGTEYLPEKSGSDRGSPVRKNNRRKNWTMHKGPVINAKSCEKRRERGPKERSALWT